MSIKQVSIFLENRQGSLEEITTLLGDGGIDLIALSMADTTDFGILRAIVDDNEKALDLAKKKGFTASLTDVLAVSVSDSPGGLAKALQVLRQGGVFIEYLYSLVRRVNHNAIIIFRVDKPADAEKLLREQGFLLLEASDITGK